MTFRTASGLRTALGVLALAAGTAAFAPSAGAQSVAALVGPGTIAVLDAGSLAVRRTVEVTGVTGGLLGIDVRPADGMLYGLAGDGTVVTIAPDGRATMKARLETMLPAGVGATVDFNPVADRLRVIGSDGTNLRVNVDDGKTMVDGRLKFADGDPAKGSMPKVVAGAYTNSMKGAKETVLYDIDAGTGTLVRQVPPNDGVLNAVGPLGVAAPAVAFDIVAMDGGGNVGFLVAGNVLHRVDLATGKATAVGAIKGLAGPVRDIAVLPGAW